jgi:hypothetical protein
MKLTEVDDSSGAAVFEIQYDTDDGFEVYKDGARVGFFDNFVDAEAFKNLLAAGGTFSYDKYGKRVYKPSAKEPKGG